MSRSKREATMQPHPAHHQRAVRRRWWAGFEQRTSPEPVFAAMMHVINRLVAGAAPATELEEECARIYRHSPEVARKTLARLAREYQALPKALRARTAPVSMVRLDPGTPLSRDLLRTAAAETVRRSSHPVTPRILEASLNTANTLVLLGSGFAAGASAVSVTVGPLHRAAAELLEVPPLSVTAGTIHLQLPPALQREQDLVVRVVRHDPISQQVRDATYELYKDLLPFFPDPAPAPAPAPPPPPKITRLEPDGSRAGEVVLIDGENFTPYIDLNGCRVHVEDLDRETGFAVHILANNVEDKEGWRAEVRSATQIRLRLGYDIPPGRYSIRVSDDTTKLTSDLAPYKIMPWRYRVNFLNFSCTDESNEASGSDEVVTAWAVSADEKFFLKSTYEYEGVDQGGTYDYRNEDRSVLTPEGDAFPVNYVLSVVTRLYEWDNDAQTRLHAEDASYKIAQMLSSSTNSSAQAAGVVVILAGLLADALSSLGSGADPLGEQKLVWTAPELLKATRNAQRRFEGELPFNNPDSEGSHIVRYEVLREF